MISFELSPIPLDFGEVAIKLVMYRCYNVFMYYIETITTFKTVSRIYLISLIVQDYIN